MTGTGMQGLFSRARDGVFRTSSSMSSRMSSRMPPLMSPRMPARMSSRLPALMSPQIPPRMPPLTPSRLASTLFLGLALSMPSSLLLAHGENAHDDEPLVGTGHAREDELARRAAEQAAAERGSEPVVQAALPPPDPADYDVFGYWDPLVLDWPHVAVSAANLPDGRILSFSASEVDAFPGNNPEFTHATVWDPLSGSFTDVSHAGHDMFCGAPVTLDDGRIFISGGRNHVKTTSVFDAVSNEWTTLSDQMNNGRWYPTSLALSDGTIMTGLGSSGGRYAELWKPSEGWQRLTGIDFQSPVVQYNDGRFYEGIWWPYFAQDPQGDVIHYGPTPRMHRLTLEGNGSVEDVGRLSEAEWYPKHGASVMYDYGKILLAGGARRGNSIGSTDLAMTIDVTGSTPRVDESIAPMVHKRKFANAIALPNGEVMMVGGNTNGEKFNDDAPVLASEVWNPETETWRELASQREARTYHSVALLMMDGRVWSAGGGLCGGCGVNHLNAEIFSPPYLFNDDGSLATRPVIVDAPETSSHGDILSVAATPGLSRFTLIKMSSTTHGVNTDQRMLAPSFTEFPNGRESNYEVQLESNPHVLPAGYYMLFAVDADGTPSVAKSIRIFAGGSQTNYPPSLDVDAVNTLRVNSPVTIGVESADVDDPSITHSASGLPPGLTIDSDTGDVSGIPVSTGRFDVTITVTDTRGESNVVTREWTVGEPADLEYSVYSGDWNALPDFAALTPEETGKTGAFDIGVASASDYFGVRFSGAIRIEQAGNYTFYTASDDGSRLYIDGRLVVDNDGLHGIVEEQGSVNLSAGFHAIRVDYFEKAGGEALRVQVAGPGIGKRAVSPDALFPEASAGNRQPLVADPGALRDAVGDNVSRQMSSRDPDGDAVRWIATGLPDGLSINASTGLISGRVTSPGDYTITLHAVDGRGGVDSVNVVWTFAAARALRVEPLTTSPQQAGQTVTFVASASGGVSPRYRWDFGDGSALTAFSTDPSTSHVYAEPGRYLVILTVSSADGTSVTERFVQNIHRPRAPGSPAASSSVVYEVRSGEHDRLWNVNPDNDTLSVTNVDANALEAEIPVGDNPRALALSGDGDVWVTNRKDDTITVIDGASLSLRRVIQLPRGSQPHGIVRDRRDRGYWVALAGSGRVARVDRAGMLRSQTLIGGELRHLSSDAAGKFLYVPRYVTPALPGESTVAPRTRTGDRLHGGEVVTLDTVSSETATIVLRHSDATDAENAGRGVPNYLGPVVISPDGTSGWVSSKQDNVLRGANRDGRALDHDNTVRAITSAISLATNDEIVQARIDHDDAGVASTGVFGPNGVYLYVALEASREVAMIDVHDGVEVLRMAVGRAPQGVAISPDGMSLFVHNFMDRSISRLDVSGAVQQGSDAVPLRAAVSTVADESLSPAVLAGKRLFYDAFDFRLAAQRYMSCASCHNDGGHDGRTWDLGNFGEGLRNTIDLRGHGGMQHGPLHWSGNFDEVQDFEGQIRSLAHGTGLMSDGAFERGTRSDPLGDPKAGVSVALDRLAAYVSSLTDFPRSPHREADGSFPARAIEGQALFASKGCASCHAGDSMTDSALDRRHDIGTLADGSGNRLGAALDGIDTPTLRGLWSSPPYLHNGSAATLGDAIRAHDSVTATAVERDRLTRYLHALESREDDPPDAPSDSCAPPAYDAAVDRALIVWQGCDGIVHVVGAGGNASASYAGVVKSDQPIAGLTLHSVEPSDRVVVDPASTVDFAIGLGGVYVDEFRYSLAPDATSCITLTSQSADTRILAGPDRTPMTSPFDPATLGDCAVTQPLACGSPGVDPASDAGLFVWQDCDGPWNVMLTGVEGASSVGATGALHATDPLTGAAIAEAGFTGVVARSLESSDTLADQGTHLRFDLVTGHPYNDRFEFDLAASTAVCVDVGTEPSDLPVTVGEERRSMDGPFDLVTLEPCVPPGVNDCQAPSLDTTTDRALFVWTDCEGKVHLLGAGGSGSAHYRGHVHADADFVALDSRSLESSDTLVARDPRDVYFDMSMGGGYPDEIILTPAAGASLCVVLVSQSDDTRVLGGAERREVSSGFDPATFAACTPPSSSDCGDPRVDQTSDQGLFVWQDCDGRWSLMVTGDTGGSTARFVGTISSSSGFESITRVSLEDADSLGVGLDSPLAFDIATVNPYSDRFDFRVEDGAELCVTLSRMPPALGRFIGADRTSVTMSFDPVSGGSC